MLNLRSRRECRNKTGAMPKLSRKINDGESAGGHGGDAKISRHLAGCRSSATEKKNSRVPITEQARSHGPMSPIGGCLRPAPRVMPSHLVLGKQSNNVRFDHTEPYLLASGLVSAGVATE